MRTIGVVTVGRSDYGIYLPLLRRLHDDSSIRLELFVSGMHLLPQFGQTVTAIERDGFPIAARIATLSNSDAPAAIAKAIGAGVTGFANAFDRKRPDLLVVLGDRFEMYAAAVAALPFKIPVAHIHGGELTQGAIDDSLRHSLTKLSHLHFVSTEEYARRVRQLGEEPWRVTVSGAPSLDNLRTLKLQTRAELAQRFRLDLTEPPLLVTFHPVTLEYERTEAYARELLAALDAAGLPVVFTAPNSDTHGCMIRRQIAKYLKTHRNAAFVENFGTAAYFSLMACSRAMVGNSSSGILEAPSFKLPVVNIGTRQDGRLRAANVIDVGYRRQDILAGIRRAAQLRLHKLTNPYGDGHAAERIVARLRRVPLNDRLIQKQFSDLPAR